MLKSTSLIAIFPASLLISSSVYAKEPASRYLFVGTYQSGSVVVDIEIGCGGSIRGPFKFVGRDGTVVVDVPAGKSLPADMYPDAGKVCAGKP